MRASNKSIQLSTRQLSNFKKLLSKSKKEPRSGCVIWSGRFDQHNRARFGNRNFIAARVLWVLAYGEVKNDLCVLHSCDNPKCVNLKHLWLGTHLDNMRDMYKKERRKYTRASYEGFYLESIEKVDELKKLWSQGFLVSEMVDLVNLSQPTVEKIVRRFPVICPICNRKFSCRKGVGMHIRRSHR